MRGIDTDTDAFADLLSFVDREGRRLSMGTGQAALGYCKVNISMRSYHM